MSTEGARRLVEGLRLVEVVREPPEHHFDPARAMATWAPLLDERIRTGSRIGVAVGSRGIASLAEVVAALVGELKARGAKVVLIPAMGSHGGATPDGQLAVVRAHGIDPDALGIEVDASMEVDQIGSLASGRSVYCSKAARACDGVIPVNRVKPHTNFRAPVESGLVKMLTIGLGKEQGASTLHVAGFPAFVEVLPEAASLVLAALTVPFGVALLEDAWHRLRRIEAVPGEVILEREPALLEEAWANFSRLAFEEVDVLVVRELSKMISGAGMDPNVTGRFLSEPVKGFTSVGRLVVLDVREDSHGNATGMGAADVTTERLRRKIDWDATYTNVITSKSLEVGRLPVVAPNDLDAIALAFASLTGPGVETRRFVAMANTLDLDHLAISEPLAAAATAAGYRLVGECRPELDSQGALLRIGGLRFFG